MSYSPVRVRRTVAWPQLVALLLSLGLGFQVSVCPPGMDTGMEMPMPMDAGSPVALGQSPGDASGMECPFSGLLDEDGRASCPLAVGGIGPCGTNAPVPSESVTVVSSLSLRVFAHTSVPSGHEDFSLAIQLPPPRA